MKNKENADSVKTFEGNESRYDVREILTALGSCLASHLLLCAFFKISLKISVAKAPPHYW